nr:hypothetical protein [Tanacetum cinerariifolium]
KNLTKIFPLPVIEFPLAEELPTASEEGCHCQKKVKATAVKVALLSIVKKKLRITFNLISLSLSIHNKKWINNIPPLPKYQSWIQENSSNGSFGYNNIFNMSIMPRGSGESGKKSGRMVTLTAEDMQKKKNNVKARSTLLLSLPDEHQLRFSKYKTA